MYKPATIDDLTLEQCYKALDSLSIILDLSFTIDGVKVSVDHTFGEHEYVAQLLADRIYELEEAEE